VLSPAWLGSIHVSAHAEAAAPAVPTGIDYLHLVEDRHLNSLGERLRYAQLADPAQPDQDSSAPVGAEADRRPPPDVDGVPHDTDLLTLADTDHTVPAQAPPDPALEAELATFAAFAAMAHRSDTDGPDGPDGPDEEQNR